MMKLAMAQMQMAPSLGENLEKTLQRIERAAELDADLLFFPEVQLSPFFAAVRGGDASQWLLRADGTAQRMPCSSFMATLTSAGWCVG